MAKYLERRHVQRECFNTSLHVRLSYTGVPCRRIPGTGFQPFYVALGFWIPIVRGIPDSLSCILNSKAQDCWLCKRDFITLLILQAKTTRIPEFGFPLHVGRDTIPQTSNLVTWLLFTPLCWQPFRKLNIRIEREQTAKQSVFLRIQVRASSQTKGVERGWKQRTRLGRDAKNTKFWPSTIYTIFHYIQYISLRSNTKNCFRITGYSVKIRRKVSYSTPSKSIT